MAHQIWSGRRFHYCLERLDLQVLLVQLEEELDLPTLLYRKGECARANNSKRAV